MRIYGIDGNCFFAGATFSSSSLSPPILIIKTKNSPLWDLCASGRLPWKSDICAAGSTEMCVCVKLSSVCEFCKHLHVCAEVSVSHNGCEWQPVRTVSF